LSSKSPRNPGAVLSIAISFLSHLFNRYYLGIAIDIGINITLAVSLNLINGHTGQFSLGDHRSLDEVIRDVAQMGYIPSFCTACYRMGRTGADFMDLAKPGLIKRHCSPNALSSFVEYLEDYASIETKAVGEKLIQQELQQMTPVETKIADRLMTKVRIGQRDVYV
jgi:2-iminoacetate synthase